MLDRDTILKLAREIADIESDHRWRESFEFDDFGVIRFAHAIASLVYEDAAARCASVLDEKEEARAEKASRDAVGTRDELPRLRHSSTVRTFNAGIRRCIAAIRQRAGEVKP